MKEPMRINGLRVDTQKIADGMYAIICEKGEEALVAFGMLPKWLIDILEKMLREKIIRLACQQMKFSEAATNHIVEIDKLGMLTAKEPNKPGSQRK